MLVAERRSDHVHVPGRVLRRVQAQRVAVALPAGLAESHLLGDDCQQLGGVVRRVVGVDVALDERIIDAVDSARAVDATGIEADDVEATAQTHLGVEDRARPIRRTPSRKRPAHPG